MTRGAPPDTAKAAAQVVAEVRRRGQLSHSDARLVAGGSPAQAAEALRRAKRRLRPVADLLLDPGQARLAERRLTAALRRAHRQEPLSADIRTDSLLARLREDRTAPRPQSHRGAQLMLDDDALRALLDEMVADGRVLRRGHRVRLPDHVPMLGASMRRRADSLLAELRAAGVAPPRAESIARRAGIPEPVVGFLRASGELVSLAPDIDYPSDVYERLQAQLRQLEAAGPLTVARIRDAIGGSRRYAAALLAARARVDAG